MKKKNKDCIYVFSFVIMVLSIYSNLVGDGSKTLRQYLSGVDNRSDVIWDFYCTGGRNSGYWGKIRVPSCWEQEGYGNYNYGRDYYTYGRDYKYSNEEGIYRYRFYVSDSLQDRQNFIVFEGVMTDCEVKINGKVAGKRHRGAFYRFRYDISDKLIYGAENELEVHVWKMSDNRSVNLAERYADCWIFGGIYRPVYIESKPRENIDRVAIVAEMDGRFDGYVYIGNVEGERELIGEIIDGAGNVVCIMEGEVGKGDSLVILKGSVENPKLWSSEYPNLYRFRLSLRDKKGKVLHRLVERFGFRSIEVRQGDGIYINGRKIKFKGINRHCIWPETGRSLNPEIDLMDVKLIKEMNMNAVRCSHYPPDVSFLDLCDSLGLYVIDELAGWHNAYDTEVGEELVKEMVIRDVNHPSVIFWSNGNEGGTNPELDDDFHKWDPSRRPIIHPHHRPGHAFSGIETNHYESYESVKRILKSDSLIYMTTEFLHSQNDGGGGAGLRDYWELMYREKLSAGGFLWALLDEGVVRTDLRGIIDVNGVNAPDGVLGPHREKEGSFYAIRDIFSPVVVLDKRIKSNRLILSLENRYDFTNLNDLMFKVKVVCYRYPWERISGHDVIWRKDVKGPDIKPKGKGELVIEIPKDKLKKGEGIKVYAIDRFGMVVMDWDMMLKNGGYYVDKIVKRDDSKGIEIDDRDSIVVMKGGDIEVGLCKNTGKIVYVYNKRYRRRLSFSGGEIFPTTGKLEEVKIDKGDGVVDFRFSGEINYVRWKIYDSGWLELDYSYRLDGEYNFSGISFEFPESHMLSVKWLGCGPYRVWKNRVDGVRFDVWENGYNNTTTGESPWIYPEFKGYFKDVVWMEFNSVEGKFYIVSGDSGLYYRLFDFYGLPGIEPSPELPSGDISIMDAIPPIGTKMSMKINARAMTTGPMGYLNKLNGTFKHKLYFYFGWL